jgi:hypothetical protein
MADKKKTKGWNFAEMQDSLVKDTEQKIEQGFKEIADGGTGQPAAAPMGGEQSAPVIQPVREITAPAGQQQPSVFQEPMQNINIPIPTSQHMRLKIIKLLRLSVRMPGVLHWKKPWKQPTAKCSKQGVTAGHKFHQRYCNQKMTVL